MIYCITYILSCFTKHSSEYKILMLGRILGGIATSLLFSAFESWLVAEHNKVTLCCSAFSHFILALSWLPYIYFSVRYYSFSSSLSLLFIVNGWDDKERRSVHCNYDHVQLELIENLQCIWNLGVLKILKMDINESRRVLYIFNRGALSNNGCQ